MSKLRIDIRCVEYYDIDLYCDLPYGFTQEDIDDVYSNGYGEIAVELTKDSSKEFMKLARRDDLFSSNDWKEHIIGSGNMYLTINLPHDWDFYQASVEEWQDGKLSVKLRALHDDMECYEVDHQVNEWEEE
jgi:hypothetical protein